MRISHHSNYTITNYELRKHRVSLESLMNIVRAYVQAFRLYFTFKFHLSLKRFSLVFDEVLDDHAPEANYTMNGNNHTMGYYLTDDIYIYIYIS